MINMKAIAKGSEVNMKAIDKGSEDFISVDTMSVVVIGCVTGFFLIFLLCVIVMLIKARISRSKRPLDKFLFECHDDNLTCKSAPISRKSSPKLDKRLSYPGAYGSVSLDDAVVHSKTFDTSGIPHFLLPPERIQPVLNQENSTSDSALHHQHSYLGAIQENNGCRSEGEMLAFPGDGPFLPASQHGRLWFTILHDTGAGKLVVTLVKLKELPGRGLDDNTRDPFVKAVLMPDEDICRTSKVIKKSLNPVFNEMFVFDVGDNGLTNRSIRFSVYDVDKRRVRHSLGHVIVPLRDLDLTSSSVICKDLEIGTNNAASAGEINVGLTYLPHIEKIKILILKTRNLRPTSNVDIGLLARLQFRYGNKTQKTKQTLIRRSGAEASFNESFSFSTSGKNIENVNFNVTVMQRSRDSTTDDVEVGYVNLGSFMFARGAGLLHWQEMMTKTRNVVTKWHPLILSV